MAVVGGSPAGRWVLASRERGVSVRAPLEVLAVAVNPGLRAENVGGALDRDQVPIRVASEPLTVQVSGTWRAATNQDDLRPAARALAELYEQDPGLGRPPIVLLSWAHLRVQGVVTACSIQWVGGAFRSPPYLPRGFDATITVARTRPRAVVPTTRFQRKTVSRRIGPGETFEVLAQAAYGDPDLGAILRAANPQIPLAGEQDGDVVRLLDASDPLLLGPTTPQSPALAGDVTDVLQALAVERLAASARGPGLEALEAELGL